MRKVLFVWQKEWGITPEGRGNYHYYTTPWQCFVELLKKYNMAQFLKSTRFISKWCSCEECLQLHNSENCNKIVFAVPHKQKKEFRQNLTNFKFDREVDKGFHIKENSK